MIQVQHCRIFKSPYFSSTLQFFSEIQPESSVASFPLFSNAYKVTDVLQGQGKIPIFWIGRDTEFKKLLRTWITYFYYVFHDYILASWLLENRANYLFVSYFVLFWNWWEHHISWTMWACCYFNYDTQHLSSLTTVLV